MFRWANLSKGGGSDGFSLLLEEVNQIAWGRPLDPFDDRQD